MTLKELMNAFYKTEIQDALHKLGEPKTGKKEDLVNHIIKDETPEHVLNAFTYKDLKSVCSMYKTGTQGKKADLVNNLLDLLNNKTEVEKKFSSNMPIEKLNSMIGLESVKKHINKIDAFLKVQKARKDIGFQEVKISKHMVFTGNPGTGKTTVAKIVADILKEFGFLSKGDILEVTRSDFIGQYLGESEKKTAEIFKKAEGSILFVDEAYSIFQGGGDEFGKAILPAFLTNLESYRDDMVVIIAGYKAEMDKFLDSDPGLRSRFSEYIHFDDFNSEELIEIFKKLTEENDYQLSQPLESSIMTYIEQERCKANFSNARFVRNSIEKLIQNHALRISSNLDKCSEQELKTLEVKDLS
ncbi:AAA family ATPase [Pseudoalteromonas sp. 2CM39R]|uniref:AAA family ATPase n=1 Tax=Pseudoalteromonas sp. 2CM39R TaxID=2929856 RepID=UPI0020BFE7A2|nr:AAA family ATPase [Pseudoalteromonas sp. 2CM39R]MCK8123739.1 AAA family ATPase [Pseudoalteromonas sp. 2CM39R]